MMMTKKKTTRTRRFIKLTIGAELRTQIVTSIKVRRGPANDNRDFEPVVRRAHAIKPIKIGIGDKGYDAEKNHELLRDELHAMSIIPARHEDVPVWRTKGRYRKEMKRGYSKKTYHQRSKDETIFSVIKRTMGDEVRSIGVKGQNNEMRFKIIAYNAARIASLAYSLLGGFLQSRGSPTVKDRFRPLSSPRTWSSERSTPGRSGEISWATQGR
jgi:hypothetical protein